MSEESAIAGIKVPQADWEATPASIQALVLVLSDRLTQLEEKLHQNSQNSSKPPSTDVFGKPVNGQGPAKPRQRQPRAFQAPRQARQLVAVEACAAVHEVLPTGCTHCGALLSGQDVQPQRQQVLELPPVAPSVVEYRLHQLRCEQCGKQTRSELPAGVSPSGYGERLTAVVALLSGPYRQSHRQVLSLMSDVFGVRLSRGCVGRLRQEMSTALQAAVCAAKDYVQAQPAVHSDETSFPQGNRDGQNPQGTQGWLWVLVTPLVSFFEVVLSRSPSNG